MRDRQTTAIYGLLQGPGLSCKAGFAKLVLILVPKQVIVCNTPPNPVSIDVKH